MSAREEREPPIRCPRCGQVRWYTPDHPGPCNCVTVSYALNVICKHRMDDGMFCGRYAVDGQRCGMHQGTKS